MFVAAPMPSFSPTSWACHKPSHPSPLASSPIRASSPLSPSSGNAVHRNAFSSPPGPSTLFKFSTRPTKPNPVLRRRDEGQAARRTLFLKNVRGRADDQRWERRSIEGYTVRNWYQEERELAKIKEMDQAAVFSEADIEEAAVLASQKEENPADAADEMMVDDIARQEELELDALLASFNEPPKTETPEAPPQRPTSSYFSDDDDDYDEIFMELVQTETGNSAHESDQMEMC